MTLLSPSPPSNSIFPPAVWYVGYLKTLPSLHDCYVSEGPEVEFMQIRIEYTRVDLYTFMQRSPAAIQTPTHWNLIGSRMTAPPSVILPNSILPPAASQYAFLSIKKISSPFEMLFQLFNAFKTAWVGECLWNRLTNNRSTWKHIFLISTVVPYILILSSFLFIHLNTPLDYSRLKHLLNFTLKCFYMFGSYL
jgi:hypothetical protein